MKILFYALATAAMTCLTCSAATAPRSLVGKTAVLNYSNAEYRTVTPGESDSGWVIYSLAKKGVRGAAEAFTTTSVGIKASRNLLPLTPVGKGGIYTYNPLGGAKAQIVVDMWKSKKNDMSRVINLHFTSSTTAVATEEVVHGDYFGYIRNIKVTIK